MADEADDDDEADDADEDADDLVTDGSDGEVDDPDDAAEDRPTEETGREGRGSATSERVHEALTLDGELRPGDEGWGAAVSESARAGGHGQRVSRAARGEEAPPAPAPADGSAGGGEDAAGGRRPAHRAGAARHLAAPAAVADHDGGGVPRPNGCRLKG
jgi:hypothetical protein